MSPSPLPPSLSTLPTFPPELRHQILASTALIPRDASGQPTGLHVDDGVLSKGPAHDYALHSDDDDDDCACPAPPTALLESLRATSLAADARTVLLSQNRIVLSGSFAASLKWLCAQGALVREIRQLDLCVDPEQVEAWGEGEGEGESESLRSGEWAALIAFIRAELNLGNLTLALDAGLGQGIYEEQQVTEANGQYVLDSYRKIVEPLRGMGGQGLKAFLVFWALYHENEAEAEREVMGEGYVARGKVESGKRDPFHPHRCLHKG
ncbi:hypothetical protein MMC34_006604 [Xylographa carneopallida]|nr:hypothetical protein [Xylographa carneopallida]